MLGNSLQMLTLNQETLKHVFVLALLEAIS
jgi:hypothetical protein